MLNSRRATIAVTASGSETIVAGTSMPVKTEKELSETQRSLWLKAMTAIEVRNFGYAISLLQEFSSRSHSFSRAVNYCGLPK